MSDCAICLRTLLRYGKLTGLLCGHVFHVDCIVKWEKTSSACPSCRTPITHHALQMGSTETMQVFENVQLMAENVLAHNMRQQQLQPQQAQQEVQQQQQQQVQHQPQQPIAEIETEMVSELQVNESVRYEMTTSRQETFLARY